MLEIYSQCDRHIIYCINSVEKSKEFMLMAIMLCLAWAGDNKAVDWCIFPPGTPDVDVMFQKGYVGVRLVE